MNEYLIFLGTILLFVFIMGVVMMFNRTTRETGMRMCLIVFFGSAAGILWHFYGAFLGALMIVVMGIVTFPPLFNKIKTLTNCK